MKQYRIELGTFWGLATDTHIITVDDYEYEGDALYALIDKLEGNGEEGYFISDDEIESCGYKDDMYVSGGKHGRNLYHGGAFVIREL
jgi:hypothetical protein